MKTIEAYECQFCHKKLFNKEEMKKHEDACSNKRSSRLINILYNTGEGWRYSVSDGSPICIIKKKLPNIEGRISIEEDSINKPSKIYVFYSILTDPKEESLPETFQTIATHIQTKLVLYGIDNDVLDDFINFVETVKNNIDKPKEN